MVTAGRRSPLPVPGGGDRGVPPAPAPRGAQAHAEPGGGVLGPPRGRVSLRAHRLASHQRRKVSGADAGSIH